MSSLHLLDLVQTGALKHLFDSQTARKGLWPQLSLWVSRQLFSCWLRLYSTVYVALDASGWMFPPALQSWEDLRDASPLSLTEVLQLALYKSTKSQISYDTDYTSAVSWKHGRENNSVFTVTLWSLAISLPRSTYMPPRIKHGLIGIKNTQNLRPWSTWFWSAKIYIWRWGNHLQRSQERILSLQSLRFRYIFKRQLSRADWATQGKSNRSGKTRGDTRMGNKVWKS